MNKAIFQQWLTAMQSDETIGHTKLRYVDSDGLPTEVEFKSSAHPDGIYVRTNDGLQTFTTAEDAAQYCFEE